MISQTPGFTEELIGRVFGSFVTQSPIRFNANAGVISINTQARRLGCFIYLIGKVADHKNIESLLLSLPSDEIAMLKENLVANDLRSGYLTDKQSSIKHYLEAALELSLLVRQGAVFRLTSRGQFLVDAIRPDVTSPYPLSAATKTFFFYTILERDYFGIVAVIRSLLAGKRRVATIQRDHRDQLLRVLSEVVERSRDSRFNRVLQDRILSIRNWKKPESYAEHLVSAKLNWLADLGVLQGVPLSTAEVLVSKPHEAWASNLMTAVFPTDTHLVACTLRYSALINVESSPKKSDFCAALDIAFNRLAGSSPLKKIRTIDFRLFLLCFHSDLLVTLTKKACELPVTKTLRCREYSYETHFATRSTQSFIIGRSRKRR
ncbi:MAG: hypothetical protein AABN95_23695 [Acidobacteriota bacterium]